MSQGNLYDFGNNLGPNWTTNKQQGAFPKSGSNFKNYSYSNNQSPVFRKSNYSTQMSYSPRKSSRFLPQSKAYQTVESPYNAREIYSTNHLRHRSANSIRNISPHYTESKNQHHVSKQIMKNSPIKSEKDIRSSYDSWKKLQNEKGLFKNRRSSHQSFNYSNFSFFF